MNELLEAERINRLDNNHERQVQTFTSMIALCKSDGDLLVLLKLLSKKKNQVKLSYQWLIDKVFETHTFGLNSDVFPEENVNFMKEVLVSVIEGKLYLERQRRSYAVYLRTVYEKFGMYREALEVSFNVPIETFSSLSLFDIAEYQLEVLRLCIINRDYIRGEILMKKIKKKHLDTEDGKYHIFLFSLLQIDFYIMVDDLLEAAKILIELLDVSDMNDEPRDVPNFKYFFELSRSCGCFGRNIKELFCIYASFFTIISKDQQGKKEQLGLLQRHKYNVEEMRRQISYFQSIELINKEEVMLVLRRVDSSYEGKILTAINDHNLKIISQFCTSITFSDLSQLLMTPINKCVDAICNGMTAQTLGCKMNQDSSTLFFNCVEEQNSKMVEKVLLSVDKAVTNIRKESLRRQLVEIKHENK